MRPARAVEGVWRPWPEAPPSGAADEQFCYDGCEAKDVWSLTAGNADGRYGRF